MLPLKPQEQAKAGADFDDIIHNTEEVVLVARETAETVSSQEAAMQHTSDSFHDMDTQIQSLMTSLGHITQYVEYIEEAKNTSLHAVESISSISSAVISLSPSKSFLFSISDYVPF